jgi:hypothetical protein
MQNKGLKVEKWDLVIGLLFLFFFVFIVLIIVRKNNKRYDEVRMLVEMKLDGRIVKIVDTKRDTYHLQIKSKDTIYHIRGLPFDYYKKKYNVVIGDSISKESKSKVITFYKLNNGMYVKMFNYELYTQD